MYFEVEITETIWERNANEKMVAQEIVLYEVMKQPLKTGFES
jgi:hypothetical protein